MTQGTFVSVDTIACSTSLRRPLVLCQHGPFAYFICQKPLTPVDCTIVNTTTIHIHFSSPFTSAKLLGKKESIIFDLDDMDKFKSYFGKNNLEESITKLNKRSIDPYEIWRASERKAWSLAALQNGRDSASAVGNAP